MKKLCFALLVALAAVAATGSTAPAAPTATRHVSTAGTDAGNCTSSPCRTIGYAVGQANAGDTVAVAAGTYAESVTLTKQLALLGDAATVDAAGHLNGIVISGAGSAGTSRARLRDHQRQSRRESSRTRPPG